LGAFASLVGWSCLFIVFDRFKEIFAEAHQEVEANTQPDELKQVQE
jgi:hypothetical protein